MRPSIPSSRRVPVTKVGFLIRDLGVECVHFSRWHERVRMLSKVPVVRTDLVGVLSREWALDTRDFLRRRILRSTPSLVVKGFRYSRAYAIWGAEGMNDETRWTINNVTHAENAS